MRNIYMVWLLLCLCGFTLGCQLKDISSFGPLKVNGYYGGSVVLPCNCQDLQSKPRNLTWLRTVRYFDEVPPLYKINEGDKEPEIQKDCEGRVAWVDDGSPGNLALVIYNLRHEDAMTYRCQTERGMEYLELTVKDCDLASSGERLEISKVSGESVLLPCWCAEKKAKPQTLRWKDPNGRLIRSESQQSGRFAHRVEMFNDNTIWNVSLLLSDLTVDDEGEYTCEINGKDNKVVYSLTVTDCTLSGQDEVVEVEAQPGSSILLPCACTTLEAKPQNFRWTPPNNREIHWHYRGRAELFHQTAAPGNLSLLLSKLTPEDEGVYRCEAGEGKSKVFVLTVRESFEQP